MLNQRKTNRRTSIIGTLIAWLFILPLTVAFATDPQQTGQNAAKGQQTAAATPAILRGRVTNEAGGPLGNVRVRVAIAATDMRFVDSSTPHEQREAKTNAKGEYRLELPQITKPTTISIDAMKPGYRRLVGTLANGGDEKSVEVAPGSTADASLILKPALHFAGVVVDEDDRPVPAVKINANGALQNASAGIEITASESDGSFELFNYPLEPLVLQGQSSKGLVNFFHPNYLGRVIEDVYVMKIDERETIRIVLQRGHQLAGTVLDTAGAPVPNAMVRAVREDGRKATTTDANGKFALRGLSKGSATLTARALHIKQKMQMSVDIDGDQNDLEIKLEKLALPADLKVYTVLGMQLADVTPKLKGAYDLYFDHGALILDPGNDSDRLKVGRLAEGYNFWIVGNKRVGNVREFVDQILIEATGPSYAQWGVRVVFRFSTPEADGNNTQYLKLTSDDLKQLRTLYEKLNQK